jgi:hypothetical protein
MKSVKAIVQDEKIKFLDEVDTSDPKKVIVTFLEDDEITYEELHQIADKGGSFDFLEEEEELYSDRDLKVKYRDDKR